MTIHVNGVTLFYELRGSGQPMILLHGNGEDHTIFDELADKLKHHFTVYMVDSRNHGQSSKTEDYSYDTMAEDLYVMILSLSLGKVHVLGFSDGAIIALKLAMKHSGAVSKMALLGINLSPEDFTEENYQFVLESYRETGDPLFKLMLEQPDMKLDELRNVNISALVIAAEHDLFKPETFGELVKALPNARLKLMPGHEHDSYIVHQDMLYPDMIDFFGK